MANLGTLDQVQLLSDELARNVVRNGSDTDKIAALVGAYLGQRMGQRRRNKDNEKLDNIVNNTKANPNDQGYVADESGIRAGNAGISPQDYNYIMGGEPAISAGNPVSLPNDQALTDAVNLTNSQQMPNAERGYNPNYNWSNIKEQARKAGISSAVLDNRQADIQKDIADTANAYYLPQIQKKLYGTNDSPATTDSILEGMSMLNELQKYSPDTAKAYQALAINGLQGNAKFDQQRQLQQLRANNQAITDARRLQNRIDYRNATANIGRNSRSGGYDPTKVANAGKRIQEIDEIVRDGGELTPRLRQEYNAHSEYLNSVYNSQLGNSQGGQPANNAGTSQTTPAQQPKQKTSEVVQGIIDSIDYGNYDNDKLAEGKQYNFIKGTQAAVDTMRGAGASDDQIFKAIDTTLAQKEANGELPAGYREDFAHSMGRKTEREVTDEFLRQKEEEAKRLDMQLHPEKYGIDPFSGVKRTGSAIANGTPLWNLASR